MFISMVIITNTQIPEMTKIKSNMMKQEKLQCSIKFLKYNFISGKC